MNVLGSEILHSIDTKKSCFNMKVTVMMMIMMMMMMIIIIISGHHIFFSNCCNYKRGEMKGTEVRRKSSKSAVK